MAIKPKDIYKGRQKSRKTGKALVFIIILLIMLAIAAFFIIRSFCVYDDAGNATIVWPWESAQEQENPDTQSSTPELE